MNQKNNSVIIALISVAATLCFIILLAIVFILIKFLPLWSFKAAVTNSESASQTTSSNQQTATNTRQDSSAEQAKPTPVTMYVANVNNSIYLRSKPYEDSGNIITTIPVGTAVLWLSNVDTVFSEISYNGMSGYVKRDYLSATKPQTTTRPTTTQQFPGMYTLQMSKIQFI